ncbi:MAG: NAD(P)-binding domain-containing protein [Acidobacteria bacterium]|nr:NAD(P)-binding domain-containing protein [Acidobacteriota bacterium]
MKRTHLIIALLFLALFLGLSLSTGFIPRFGALPGMGWLSLFLLTFLMSIGLILIDTKIRRNRVKEAMAEAARKFSRDKGLTTVLPPTLFDLKGPTYPHPVINAATCIGCHACVDICPHDVLAMVNGKAAPVALDQCMEDTSCQVECPTVPKSCIVVNTTKPIPERKVPKRDQSFMTTVPGIFLIGDVSGVPLIKNAINEGAQVIESVSKYLQQKNGNGKSDYDVAIIGIGPAGLSASALAKQRGMKYIAIEQDQIAATIQQTYSAGKYVFYNPTDMPAKGGISLDGDGGIKEEMIGSWVNTIKSNGVVINEFESCKNIKPENGHFIVETEQVKTNRKMEYNSQCVILAIGNRGAASRLNVPGEEIKFIMKPTELILPDICDSCRAKRMDNNKFCQRCGARYVPKTRPSFEDAKVKYKLIDPDVYKGRHIMVVGAGNSAIEAAVDLAAFRAEDGTKITGWRDNFVSLAIRSNFRGDIKLANKMLVYECIDEGRIKAFFGQTIKEITPTEVVLMNARERDRATAQETARIHNDYIFALIGGEKPTKFLEGMGIKVS